MVSKITNQPNFNRFCPRLPNKALCLILLAILTSFLLLPIGPHSAKAQNTSPSQNKSALGLHRLDFRLEGKSCATCLLSVQRKLNNLPGVKEAVVMLKRPYGVSVIYAVGETNPDEILAIVKNKEPNIKVLEMNDSHVGKMPAILIPPFVPVNNETNGSVN